MSQNDKFNTRGSVCDTYICQRPFNSATWLFIAPAAAADSAAALGNFRPGPPEHTATPERPCTRRAGVGQERRPIPYKSFQKINANRLGRQAENAVPNRPCRRLAILRLGTGCRVKKTISDFFDSSLLRLVRTFGSMCFWRPK